MLSKRSIINAVRKFHDKELFSPSPLSIFFHPFYLARRALARSISNEAAKLSAKRILDIGCGSKPYRNLFPCKEYIGLDIENSRHNHIKQHIDVIYDGARLPFPAHSFDTVVCFQTLEHVFTPDTFLSEIHRVLKPNGKLLVTVPFIWNEHEQPIDYARYSSFGLKHLVERNSFGILHQQKLNIGIPAICQLTNAMISARRRHPIISSLILPLYFLNNITGMIASCLPWKDETIFLDNLIIAQKQ